MGRLGGGGGGGAVGVASCAGEGCGGGGPLGGWSVCVHVCVASIKLYCGQAASSKIIYILVHASRGWSTSGGEEGGGGGGGGMHNEVHVMLCSMRSFMVQFRYTSAERSSLRQGTGGKWPIPSFVLDNLPCT